jgi:hypothetical protein
MGTLLLLETEMGAGCHPIGIGDVLNRLPFSQQQTHRAQQTPGVGQLLGPELPGEDVAEGQVYMSQDTPDDEYLRLGCGDRPFQRQTFGVGDQGIVHAVHQDQAGGQAAQVLALQGERLDRVDQRLRQVGDQSRGLARIAVDQQPVNGEPLGTQPFRQPRDVGFGVLELRLHHRIEG